MRIREPATSFDVDMLTLLFLVYCIHACRAANVLCVFPTPAFSHQTVFSIYVETLQKAGHNVTVITPMPRGMANVTEVGCNRSVARFASLIEESAKSGSPVAGDDTVTANNYQPLVQMVLDQFADENVRALVSNPDNRFDLVVCEAYLSVNLVFGYLFRAPVIMFSSGYATNENFAAVDRGVSYDGTVYPNVWRSTYNRGAFAAEDRLSREWRRLESFQEKGLKRVFGSSTPSIDELKSNVRMLFVNVPPVYDNHRPVSDRVQYLGGMHLKKPKGVLESSVAKFLDAHRPAVYVSFGSMMHASSEVAEELVRVFATLPYKVLWHVDDSVVRRFNVSYNVLTRNWFQQREVLDHPNVRLFVTQGGVQSTDEAIDSGVPLLFLPMAGDQFRNSHRLTSLGVGEYVDVTRLSDENLGQRIVRMVTDRRYPDRVRKLKVYIKDVPMSSTEKALWYTEHVLRTHALE